MKAPTLTMIMASLACAACATRDDAWVPHEFTAPEAFRLASTYRLMYIGGCGWSDPPIAHAGYWEVPVYVGIASHPEGSVRVDKHTGTVSYRWQDKAGPTMTPKQLWYAVHTRRA